jgi:hypothetical protein
MSSKDLNSSKVIRPSIIIAPAHLLEGHSLRIGKPDKKNLREQMSRGVPPHECSGASAISCWHRIFSAG